MPLHTKVSFAPSTIQKIAENKKVIGFKDSSGSGSYFQSVAYEMRNKEDFSLFVGPEEMLAETVLLGANGGVNGGSNIFPKLYVKLYKAAIAGDLTRVRELQNQVMQICSNIYTQGNYGSSYLKGVKCALALKGICSDTMALPFNKFGEEQKRKISNTLSKLDIDF
jgi:4-hydroxy-tetrahydrodipicolinate synthase